MRRPKKNPPKKKPAAKPLDAASEADLAAENEYRECLNENINHGIDQYDKTVLALSGGALGISMAFIKDIITPANVTGWSWLGCAWGAWGISLCSTLASFFLSHVANREALRRWDRGERREEELTGIYDAMTKFLNGTAGICFLLGLIFQTTFIFKNEPKHDSSGQPANSVYGNTNQSRNQSQPDSQFHLGTNHISPAAGTNSSGVGR